LILKGVFMALTASTKVSKVSTAALTEFEMIQHYFKTEARSSFVEVGIGDDCAVFTPTDGKKLLVSVDMLVEGRHFLSTASPEWIAHKALAVNLSDLAACGATPKAFLLSLGLPQRLAHDEWIAPFAQTLQQLAAKYGCILAGGDTTRSETLTISITVMGESPAPIMRSTAQAGDLLWVSGTVGDAALALAIKQQRQYLKFANQLSDAQIARLDQKLHLPSPRVKLGLALRGLASSAIDVSDGIAGDIAHILKASDVDALIDVDALPISPELQLARLAGIDILPLALSGGDDYELLFSSSSQNRQAVLDAAASVGVNVTPIGNISRCETLLPKVRYCDDKGQMIDYTGKGYQHF
jgi:thiamine-monophosphate kinase